MARRPLAQQPVASGLNFVLHQIVSMEQCPKFSQNTRGGPPVVIPFATDRNPAPPGADYFGCGLRGSAGSGRSIQMESLPAGITAAHQPDRQRPVYW